MPFISERNSFINFAYFQKETSFTQNQLASHWPSLVCFISPPLLNGFQSSLVSLESYFQGESNAVCYEGRGLLFMENVGNYRNCATQIILEPFGVYPIRIYPFWTFPFTIKGILLSFLIVGSRLWCGLQAEPRVSLVVIQGFWVLE